MSAARDADGKPCVVMVPGADADSRCAADAFVEIDRAHALLDHPLIPPVVTRGSFRGTPYLELGCDAVMDGVDVHRVATDSQRRAPVAGADAFMSDMLGALQSAHAVTDPKTKRPLCIGRLSYANLLFAGTGRSYLVGFGRNFPIETTCGRPDGWLTTFQAPEVSLGGQSSPVGDYIALVWMMRSLLPLADLGPVIARILSGDVRATDTELLHWLQWPDQHLMSVPVPLRRSIEEAERVRGRIRDICGFQRDPEGFTAHVRDLITRPSSARCQRRSAAAGKSRIELGVQTSWVAGADGVRHLLGQAHQRIVTALADLQRREPGAVLTIRELLEAGWPGERTIHEAGANRVYVALTQLRRMGLREIIERSEGGYRFAQDVEIRFSR